MNLWRTVDALGRYFWLCAGFVLAFILLNGEQEAIRSFGYYIGLWALAVTLSGITIYVYTRVKFIQEGKTLETILIFLAVCLLLGLSAPAYIAQFAPH